MWAADDDFPMRLKLARAAQGWSQKELSEACAGKPTERTLWGWEAGRVRDPHFGQLGRVASVLRVDVPWLLRGEDVRGLSPRHS